MIEKDYSHYHVLTDGMTGNKEVFRYYMLKSSYADPENEDNEDPEVIAVCDFNRCVTKAMRWLAKGAELNMWYVSNEEMWSIPF